MVQTERRRANRAGPNGGPAQGAYKGRAPVTDRVNVEPAILQGMNATEAKVIGITSAVVFLVVGLLIWLATGLWQLILLSAVFGPAATLWASSSYLAGIKRGRPDGYYTQAIHLWMVEHGVAKATILRHHGTWSLGRELEMDVSSLLDMTKGTDEFAFKSNKAKKIP